MILLLKSFHDSDNLRPRIRHVFAKSSFAVLSVTSRSRRGVGQVSGDGERHHERHHLNPLLNKAFSQSGVAVSVVSSFFLNTCAQAWAGVRTRVYARTGDTTDTTDTISLFIYIIQIDRVVSFLVSLASAGRQSDTTSIKYPVLSEG